MKLDGFERALGAARQDCSGQGATCLLPYRGFAKISALDVSPAARKAV